MATTTTALTKPTKPMAAIHGESKAKVFTGWTQPKNAYGEYPSRIYIVMNQMDRSVKYPSKIRKLP